MKKVHIITFLVFSLVTFSSFAQWNTTGDSYTEGGLILKHNSNGFSGDVLSLYRSRFNSTWMYGFGLEPYTLYYKATDNHRWYIRANADEGVSSEMELSRTRLFLKSKLGIGTKSPQAGLHIKEGFNYYGAIIEGRIKSKGAIVIPQATNINNSSPAITFDNNDDFIYDNQYLNHYGFGFHNYQDGSNTLTEPTNTYVSGYFGVDFFTSGENRMRISGDGIVSIGTVARQAGYKLAVNGSVKATEIKVEAAPWSDFVFYKDYKLPTLVEVEQHIKEKGHLQDIPSAKEVEKNGIFLGEMNAKLLQKIEELTLYTIQQQKEIEKLKKEKTELNELKAKFLELEKLIKNQN